MKRSELKRNPDKLRAFRQRARASSARSLKDGKAPQKRRKAISPASKVQREKVAEMACLGCGRSRSEWLTVDPAHVVDRSLGGCDDARCVVPLCRTFDGSGCHREYEEGRLDLLPLLEPHWREEQAHAVLHLGLARAYEKTTNERRVA